MKNRDRFVRLAAVVTTALLAAYLLRFGCPHYDLGDDAILADSLFGAVGGVKESVNAMVMPLLYRPLHWLSVCFGQVVWFSVCQLVLLALSACAAVAGGMRLSDKLHLPRWLGWLVGTLFAWAFVMPFCNFISFTQTAVTTGAASVWLLLGVDWSDERAIRGRVAVSVACMTLAFCLRWESALAALVFWVGGLLCAWLIEGAKPRRVLCALLACGLAIGFAAGGRAAERAFSREGDYLRWQKASIEALDYGGDMGDELLEEIGWTRNDVSAMGDWCLLDERMSTEAFETIAARMEEKTSRSLTAARNTIRTLLRRNRNLWWVGLWLGLLCAVSFVSALLLPHTTDRGWSLLAPVLCVLALAGLMGYLALRGRLPMRAAAAALWPACAVAIYLALRGLTGLFAAGGIRRAGALAAAALLAVAMFPLARHAFQNTYQPWPLSRESAYTRLDAYALAHPDELLIAPNAMMRDIRLFPDRSQGVPDNLLLGWGSWNNHSEGYRALFARFGYRHDAFSLSDFLDSPVRLITDARSEPPAFLLDCLRERANGEIQWTAEEWETFRIYAFFAVDEEENQGRELES